MDWSNFKGSGISLLVTKQGFATILSTWMWMPLSALRVLSGKATLFHAFPRNTASVSSSPLCWQVASCKCYSQRLNIVMVAKKRTLRMHHRICWIFLCSASVGLVRASCLASSSAISFFNREYSCRRLASCSFSLWRISSPLSFSWATPFSSEEKFSWLTSTAASSKRSTKKIPKAMADPSLKEKERWNDPKIQILKKKKKLHTGIKAFASFLAPKKSWRPEGLLSVCLLLQVPNSTARRGSISMWWGGRWGGKTEVAMFEEREVQNFRWKRKQSPPSRKRRGGALTSWLWADDGDIPQLLCQALGWLKDRLDTSGPSAGRRGMTKCCEGAAATEPTHYHFFVWVLNLKREFVSLSLYY